MTDAEKEAEVIRLFTENPNETTVEVAKVTGLAQSTVHDLRRKNFGAIDRHEVLQRILEKDLKIIDKGQDVIIERIENKTIKDSPLVQANSDSTRRYQLFTDGATERIESKNLNVNINVDANKLREEFEDKLKSEYLKKD